MKSNWEAEYRESLAPIRALEQEHHAALEAGDKRQAQAIYSQIEGLYAEALKAEKEATEEADAYEEAKATLFMIDLKATMRRLARRVVKV